MKNLLRSSEERKIEGNPRCLVRASLEWGHCKKSIADAMVSISLLGLNLTTQVRQNVVSVRLVKSLQTGRDGQLFL